jgi:hypothetical protein
MDRVFRQRPSGSPQFRTRDRSAPIHLQIYFNPLPGAIGLPTQCSSPMTCLQPFYRSWQPLSDAALRRLAGHHHPSRTRARPDKQWPGKAPCHHLRTGRASGSSGHVRYALRSRTEGPVPQIAAPSAIMMPSSILSRWPRRQIGYQFRPSPLYHGAHFIGDNFDNWSVENECDEFSAIPLASLTCRPQRWAHKGSASNPSFGAPDIRAPAREAA